MKRFSNIKFEHDKRLLSDVRTPVMNFDLVTISKETQRPIIFEWLKRGPNQKHYITPFTSCPTKYLNMNKGKFFGYQVAKDILKAEVYYINYAPENTIVDNGKDLSGMVKVMRHKKLTFQHSGKRVTPTSYINKPLVIGIEEIARFNTLEAFSIWMNNFLTENCYIIDNIAMVDNNLTEKEAKIYIKNLEQEYEYQQNKARSGIAFNKYLVMPDLSGDIFEQRLDLDIDQYRVQIDKHYLNKEEGKYIFFNQMQVHCNPSDLSTEERQDIIRGIYSTSFAFDEQHVFVFVIFNIDFDNVVYVEIKNSEMTSENLSLQGYKNKIVHITE